jgi:hypothetical protein
LEHNLTTNDTWVTDTSDELIHATDFDIGVTPDKCGPSKDDSGNNDDSEIDNPKLGDLKLLDWGILAVLCGFVAILLGQVIRKRRRKKICRNYDH